MIGNGSSPVFRREALLAAGGIDPTFPGCYDLDAWLRMSLIRPGNLVAIPEFLTFYRRRPGQLTADVPMMERSFNRLIAKMRAIAPEHAARAENQGFNDERGDRPIPACRVQRIQCRLLTAHGGKGKPLNSNRRGS